MVAVGQIPVPPDSAAEENLFQSAADDGDQHRNQTVACRWSASDSGSCWPTVAGLAAAAGADTRHHPCSSAEMSDRTQVDSQSAGHLAGQWDRSAAADLRGLVLDPVESLTLSVGCPVVSRTFVTATMLEKMSK